MRKDIIAFMMLVFGLFGCTDKMEPDKMEPGLVVDDGGCEVLMYKLPVVQLECKDSIVKDMYHDVAFSIGMNGFGGDCSIVSCGGKIKVRGNSTSLMCKKPYKVKLDGRVYLDGLGYVDEVVMLANYYDRCLLRNWVAFEMGKTVGMPNVPGCLFVDVVLNGEYIGNYFLCNQVEIDKVFLGDAVLLMEIDQRDCTDGVVWNMPFAGNETIQYVVKDCVVGVDLDCYMERFCKFDSILSLFGGRFGKNDIYYNNRDFIDGFVDLDDFFGWVVVEEMFKNPDSWSFSSIFFYIGVDGKVHMGPLWDFDLGGGNYSTIDYGGDEQNGFYETKGWYILGNPYARFFCSIYSDEFTNYWNKHKEEIRMVIDRIDDMYSIIEVSCLSNYKRWYSWDEDDIFCNKRCGKGVVDNLEYMKGYLRGRYEWLDGYIDKGGGFNWE